MKEHIIDLTSLVNPPKTDSISGREFGEQHAKDTKVIDHLVNDEKIVILIDSKYVKAINDSFIKGFFSVIFNKYPSHEIKKRVELRFDDNFKRLFEKNWAILEAISNA